MKKFLTGVLAIALVLTVVAVPASSSAAAAYTFNANLTVGSRGADVVALQSFLESAGVLVIPAGVAKGYFGSLTRSALAAYQSANGIAPAVGYFGPVTRAKVNAGSTTTTTTGGTTTTGTVVTTSGSEGTIDVRLASNPSDNASVRTQNDVPVYGIEFRARIADVAIQTLDLQVGVANAGSNENPSTLINTIKVWDGSTVLATIPVTLGTFTKDQNQVYYYRLSGLNFVVPKDVTKTLTVSFSTNSIDAERVVTIDGYGDSSVRAVSGNGISSFYSINGSGYTRTHTFKKPGSSTLTLSAAAQTLRSQNYRNNGNDTLQNVVLGTFNLKSETGDSTLLTVTATTSGSVAPQTLYLYQGSKLLKSKTVVSGVATFDNLDTTDGAMVSKDTIQTYTVKGDFAASTTVNGATSSVAVGNVVYQTPNGNTANANGSAVSNSPMYIYSKVAVITLVGTPTISAQNAAITGGTSSVTAVFPINIQALGGNVVLPSNGDATVTFSNGSTATVANTSVVTIPNNDIADGSSANVTITAKSAGFPAGLYNAALTTIKWNAGNGTTTQTYGLEDFKTSAAANQQ